MWSQSSNQWSQAKDTLLFPAQALALWHTGIRSMVLQAHQAWWPEWLERGLKVWASLGLSQPYSGTSGLIDRRPQGHTACNEHFTNSVREHLTSKISLCSMCAMWSWAGHLRIADTQACPPLYCTMKTSASCLSQTWVRSLWFVIPTTCSLCILCVHFPGWL